MCGELSSAYARVRRKLRPYGGKVIPYRGTMVTSKRNYDDILANIEETRYTDSESYYKQSGSCGMISSMV